MSLPFLPTRFGTKPTNLWLVTASCRARPRRRCGRFGRHSLGVDHDPDDAALADDLRDPDASLWRRSARSDSAATRIWGVVVPVVVGRRRGRAGRCRRRRLAASVGVVAERGAWRGLPELATAMTIAAAISTATCPAGSRRHVASSAALARGPRRRTRIRAPARTLWRPAAGSVSAAGALCTPCVLASGSGSSPAGRIAVLLEATAGRTSAAKRGRRRGSQAANGTRAG